MPASKPGGDTIAAIATAGGRGGIGVVRVSGTDLAVFAEAICGIVPAPRYAKLAGFHGADGSLIDQGIVLYFPAPHSFTGEDVLELQAHGGNAVLQLLLRRCLDLGARVAEPGEFTKRAFLNDKIDLAQAESVADLIDASTAEAARCAMRSLAGEFSREINALVQALIGLRMLVEATLDFPEEEADFLESTNAAGQLADVRARLGRVLAQSRQGAVLREGLQVVLIGQPNVGKSSLLNRLAGEELAIVTPVPGTTRDSVRQQIQIDGVPLQIIDTAGLRDTVDEVEQIGIGRTWAATQKAGLALLVVDATRGETDSDRTIVARLPEALPVLTVLNKVDLVDQATLPPVASRELRVSARTGQGVEKLRAHLLEAAGWHPSGEGVFMARERQLRALAAAEAHLLAAAEQGERAQFELFAEELRLAQSALSTITGEFTADDLLGEIFSRFCIGK